MNIVALPVSLRKDWLDEKKIKVKGKGESERYDQLNAEFQRRARRD